MTLLPVARAFAVICTENTMKTAFRAYVAALTLISSAAVAQTTVQTTTTSPTVPPQTLSTVHESSGTDAYGNRVDSKSTVYRDGMGATQQRSTTTTINPPMPTSTTSTTSTTTESR